MENEIPTVKWAGRTMSKQTAWWAQKDKANRMMLHCIHNVRLSIRCKQCEEENK